MKTIFDITEYGAVGDGVTINTKAIQSALDKAEECCGEVIVPPGRYLTGKLKMGRGVALKGVSAWSFRSFGASVFVLCDDSADCMIDITGAFGCNISGMSLDGAGCGEGIHGVSLGWEKYNGGSEEDTPSIDDCRIGNFSGDAVHLYHIWCFSVRHSMLCNCKGAGLFIDGWDGFILDNWFSGNRGGGISGGDCVASITATGNRVEWNGKFGFSFPEGDSYNITGNFFDRSFGPAIVFGGSGCVNTVAVSGNIFRRDGAGLPADKYDNCHLRIKNADNITITANSFRSGRDDGDTGELSPQNSIVIEKLQNSVIIGNAMKLGAIDNEILSLADSENCIIKDNI